MPIYDPPNYGGYSSPEQHYLLTRAYAALAQQQNWGHAGVVTASCDPFWQKLTYGSVHVDTAHPVPAKAEVLVETPKKPPKPSPAAYWHRWGLMILLLSVLSIWPAWNHPVLGWFLSRWTSDNGDVGIVLFKVFITVPIIGYAIYAAILQASGYKD